MTDKTITVYPSTAFSQKADRPKVPLIWAIAHLQQLLNSIPAEFRQSADITGWSDIAVKYLKILSPAEEADEDLKEARRLVKAAAGAGVGLTPAETITVFNLLKHGSP